MALSAFFERQRRPPITSKAGARASMWWRRGNHYLRHQGGMKEDDLVQPDPDMNAKILAMTEEVYPVIARAFNEHYGPMATEAFDKWPVETGLSLSLLDFTITVDGDALVGSLVNRAPYAYYIRPKKKKVGRHTRTEAELRASRARAYGHEGLERSVRAQMRRPFTPEELRIMDRPPRGVDPKKWREAVAAGTRHVDLVDYAYAQGVLKKLGTGKKTKRKKPTGRRIADSLVFLPGLLVAKQMESQIAEDMT
jgi:hypothetical protein